MGSSADVPATQLGADECVLAINGHDAREFAKADAALRLDVNDIVQGEAGPDEFRTAPLWGLGQRIFFLHDGRTRDLMDAIHAHRSPGSEPGPVIDAFDAMPPGAQQDLLNFLRSL